ncbi:ABC transporter ATP-binding protein [Streptomyces sp. NPDC002596]|uniref:ABC transporter ATP-binding protein n=1 Tax=unclassified Streptomyces TaxID=2593676 RepID=UPI002258A0D4|nr:MULTISPECIES: ABC transporter ATP-binding protein [unclassified Streptomyces]MCX4532109.1 ABC transporter ATP-binding protein [Streptomyces sp. NBC_01669]WSA02377.1 ABC transporter ATP-binding protein [Streptomyces sp. NBC_00841]
MTDSTGVKSTGGQGGTAVAEESARGPMVRVEDLHRSYGTGAGAVHALRGVSFDVPRGELVALKGRSGSGKTTLLNLVGGLDSPDRGRITVDGTDLSELGENGLLELRRDRIGFIFQSFGLIPILTAAENVGVPMRLRKADPREREDRVALLLSLVGLGDHSAQRPGELSGGQQQRVAIARALANRPALLIADEPTGQLDAETGLAVMELLRAVVRSEGVTALVATHDAQLLGLADRVLELSDGHIAEYA